MTEQTHPGLSSNPVARLLSETSPSARTSKGLFIVRTSFTFSSQQFHVTFLQTHRFAG